MAFSSSSTQVLIGDLRINFPFVPYDCQRSFMEKVVDALNFVSNFHFTLIFSDFF